MGIQINGNTNNINAGIGSLSIEDLNELDIVGVATAANFKTGTSNVHSAGIEIAGINVLGADTPIGAGATIYNSGAAVFTGIVTATNLDIEGGSASLSQLKINSTGRYRGIQLDENGTRKAHFQHDATSNNTILGTAEGTMQFNSGDTPRVTLNSSGHWVPYVDSTYDLGITGTRWRNVYADTLYGDGSNITGIAVTEAPVVDYTITANGSSAYRFHGGGVNETADDPDLYLVRGQKYRFNNTTGSSHPFAIREASGGSAYSNGVTGDDEGVQFFTVPYTAPSKIFYQCELHSGMIGNIYIRGAGGQNTNVGITTFTGLIDVTQIKKSSGTLDFLAATHTFNNAAASTEYLRINSSGGVSIGNNPTVSSDTIFHVEKSSGETNVKFEGNDTMLSLIHI